MRCYARLKFSDVRDANFSNNDFRLNNIHRCPSTINWPVMAARTTLEDSCVRVHGHIVRENIARACGCVYAKVLRAHVHVCMRKYREHVCMQSIARYIVIFACSVISVIVDISGCRSHSLVASPLHSGSAWEPLPLVFTVVCIVASL